MQVDKRQDWEWDYYFMARARQAAQMSGCQAIKVGAVLVRDRQIISSGWNAPPPETPSCIDRGYCYPGLNKCTDSRDRPSRAIHAEVNAIASVCLRGGKTQGATLYVTLLPCLSCLKMMIAFGIERVCFQFFPDGLTRSPKEYNLFTNQIKLNQLP